MEMSQEKPEWFLELMDVIAQADYVRTKYRQVSHDSPVYSIADYLEIISHLTGYDIEVTAERWGSFLIRGGCFNYDSHKAKIAVAEHKDNDPENGVSTCEQRFITVKEAAQLVIDSEESYIRDCEDFIEDILINNMPITDFRKPGRSDIFYSKIFAMELLFPWEFRKKAYEQIQSKERTMLDVATEFMIPEKELRWFLSDRLHPALETCHEVYRVAMLQLEQKYSGDGKKK